VRAFVDAGFVASGFEIDWGIALPETVHQAAFIFAASNVSLAGYGLLIVGAERLIQSFGTEDQKQRYLMPMAEGRFFRNHVPKVMTSVTVLS